MDTMLLSPDNFTTPSSWIRKCFALMLLENVHTHQQIYNYNIHMNGSCTIQEDHFTGHDRKCPYGETFHNFMPIQNLMWHFYFWMGKPLLLTKLQQSVHMKFQALLVLYWETSGLHHTINNSAMLENTHMIRSARSGGKGVLYPSARGSGLTCARSPGCAGTPVPESHLLEWLQ